MLQLLILISARNCYRVVSKTQQDTIYRRTMYNESYNCGFKTCTRTLYGTASSTSYRRVYVNEQVCCQGYFQSHHECLPICNSTCANRTVCIAPNLCGCRPGWTGESCETDINECTESNNICDQECHNTLGSFTCSCNASTTLNPNGYQCDDVDECALDHNCSTRCVNTNGSFYCTCDPGFSLSSDGRTCTDIDECLAGINQCEQVCINTIGSYQCTCFPNHTLLANLRSCLGPPQNISFSAINSTAFLLTWDAPVLGTDYSGITLYLVTCTRPRNMIITHNESVGVNQQNHATLHDLRPFTTYECCISVQTTGGDSQNGCLLLQTPEAAPSTVPEVMVQVTSSRSISASWEPPARPNGILLHYTVEVKTNTSIENTTIITVPPNASRSVDIHNLIPYVPYIVTVTASTKAGESNGWVELIHTEHGVPNISAVALRLNATSARIKWSSSLIPELAILVLTDPIVVYTSSSSDEDCPLMFDRDTQLAEATTISTQTELIVPTGLIANQEYCISVKINTVTGKTAYSPVQKLPLPSNVFIQIGLRLRDETCNNFTSPNPKTKLRSISSTLLEEILASCNCSYSTDHITLSQFLCGYGQEDVIYQAHLLNSPDVMAEDIVAHIQQWIQSQPLVNVSGALLQVDLYCNVRVMELGHLDECFTVNPTQGINRAGNSFQITLGSILGAVIGALTLILIAMCIGMLVREWYHTKEKRILNDRNLRITRGENCYVNCGFIPEERTTYKMHW